MSALLDKLFASINPDRLRDLTLELVKIPSPTGDSEAVTEFYAAQLRDLGLNVEVFHDFPHSPSTVVRLAPRKDRLTLTLDGHLDTIHTSHAAPYVDGDRIYGRGTGDMKSGVAAMVEVARVLLDNHVDLDGNLIFVTHSLHEAPVGHMEGLKALLARGEIFVDAALVAEGGFDTAALRGKGQALYEITITREGNALHENEARRHSIPNPLDFAALLANKMLECNAAWASQVDPLLGPETIFLGQIHGGDFYNRVPNSAFLNGVYRYWPVKNWDDVRRTFDELVASVARPEGINVEMRLFGNGLGFEIDPQTPILQALCSAYRTVVGRDMQLVGDLGVSDVNIIAREAKMPVVAHGTGSATAHGDVEWVSISDTVRSTRVYLATIIEFLGVK